MANRSAYFVPSVDARGVVASCQSTPQPLSGDTPHAWRTETHGHRLGGPLGATVTARGVRLCSHFNSVRENDPLWDAGDQLATAIQYRWWMRIHLGPHYPHSSAKAATAIDDSGSVGLKQAFSVYRRHLKRTSMGQSNPTSTLNPL